MAHLEPSPDQSEGELLFNVSSLLLEQLGSERRQELRLVPFHYEGVMTEISGDLAFLRTDGSILVQANLDISMPEECCHCLESYQSLLWLQFEEEFWPLLHPLSGEVPVVPEERDGFPILEGYLDMKEVVRQYVEMSRPMQPLCGDQCPGPAVERSCTAWVDGRWAVLRTLQEKLRTQ